MNNINKNKKKQNPKKPKPKISTRKAQKNPTNKKTKTAPNQ